MKVIATFRITWHRADGVEATETFGIGRRRGYARENEARRFVALTP